MNIMWVKKWLTSYNIVICLWLQEVVPAIWIDSDVQTPTFVSTSSMCAMVSTIVVMEAMKSIVSRIQCHDE